MAEDDAGDDQGRLELAALGELRERFAGTIRLTATENAAASVLWPALAKFLPNYPGIKVEIVIVYGLTGETVAKGMIALRIAPDMRMAVVGAPAYFERVPRPRTPPDLTAHRCINLRLPTFSCERPEIRRGHS